MAKNFEDSIDFSLIVESLKKLASRAKNANHGVNFERLTMNHRILSNLEIDILNRGEFNEISSSEIFMYKRGVAFRFSSTKSSIDFFRWSRASIAEDIAMQSYNSAEEKSLIVSIMSLRSLLEIVGNAALLEKDLQEISQPNDKNVARMEWLNAVRSVVDVRLEGVRVDYSELIKNGLRETKRYTYKPSLGEADKTAKDLLKGIDVLDKRIKGARAAYEFFCEFTHPNLASVLTNYEGTESRLRVIDIHGYAAHHRQRHIGAFFLKTFGSLLAEGIEIVGDCVDELLRIDLALKSLGEAASRHAKKTIRELIKNDPTSFDSRELCPCNSGMNIQRCCGKMIKASKFGSWKPSAQLH